MDAISGLSYVGKQPSQGQDVTNRGATNTLVNAITPNQTSVSALITTTINTGATLNGTLVGPYATKAAVDTQTSTFASYSYLTAQDALNLPLTAKGTVNQVGGVNTPISGSSYGVATLDSAGHVPVSQFPLSGAPYLIGPWGLTTATGGTAAGTPVKIGEWKLGTADYSFQPFAEAVLLVTTMMGQPRVEVRIANTPLTGSAPTYAASTLVAAGTGRYLYNDLHTVSVQPVPNGLTQALLPATYSIWATLWLYDLFNQSVSVSAPDIVSAAFSLLRGAT